MLLKCRGLSLTICYTDNIQLCVSFKCVNPNKLSVLHNSLTDIKDCMSNTILHHNTDKTEVFISASESIATNNVLQYLVPFRAVWSNLRNVGVMFDQAVQFNPNIKLLACTCFSKK